VAQTNQLGWTTTLTYNPAWGSVTNHIDQNGQETRVGYDGLGRTTLWGARSRCGPVASVDGRLGCCGDDREPCRCGCSI